MHKKRKKRIVPKDVPLSPTDCSVISLRQELINSSYSQCLSLVLKHKLTNSHYRIVCSPCIEFQDFFARGHKCFNSKYA